MSVYDIEELQELGFFSEVDVQIAKHLTSISLAENENENGIKVNIDDELVKLAIALSVRAARNGDGFVDINHLPDKFLANHGEVLNFDSDQWETNKDYWIDEIKKVPLLAGTEESPLVIEGKNIYLNRVYSAEQLVSKNLVNRLETSINPMPVESFAYNPGWDSPSIEEVEGWLDELNANDEKQRAAITSFLRNPFTIITGGPGTGKTYTLALALALLLSKVKSHSGETPIVKVAAFTGKASARVKESIAGAIKIISSAPDREKSHPMYIPKEVVESLKLDELAAIKPSTIHTLLGTGLGISPVPKMKKDNPLRADVVIIDEASMVSLAQMQQILDACLPQTHIVLIGDHNQLPSIDTGQVLADLTSAVSNSDKFGDTVVKLETVHRATERVQAFSKAILEDSSEGNKDKASEIIREFGISANEIGTPEYDIDDPKKPLFAEDQVAFIEIDFSSAITKETLPPSLTKRLIAHRKAVIKLVKQGRIDEAIELNKKVVILSAHREGLGSRDAYNDAMERWITDKPLYKTARHWLGQPVMVTSNDRHIGINNGDMGIIVSSNQEFSYRVALDSKGEEGSSNIDPIDLPRLRHLEIVHAMTVHKSQGSEFNTVIVILPPKHSPVLTKQLLYTAVTRAKFEVFVLGSKEVLKETLETSAVRDTGLATRIESRL